MAEGKSLSGLMELPGRRNLKDTAREVTTLQMPDVAKWMTNWDARNLETDALTYAAFDAIAAYEIHHRMPTQPPGAARRSAAAERPRARQFPRAPRQARGALASTEASPAVSASPAASAPLRPETAGSADAITKPNRAQRRRELAELRGDTDTAPDGN